MFNKIKKYQRVISIPERSFFLFGPRGVGKSTWLKAHVQAARSINLLIESTYQSFLADATLFRMQLANVKPGEFVTVDEIQRLPQLLNDIHYLIEEKKIKFALSGSSARKLKRAGVNLLAGRAIRKEMFPLTREELGPDFEIEKILMSGSLPLIWNADGDKEVLEAYVQTYLKEEIQAEALVRNLPGFHRFLPIASIFNANVINISNIARDAGIKRSTAEGYIEILEDTLLTFRLRPFEGRLRVKEKKHPKLYWIDTGIARTAKRAFGTPAPEERGHLFESWFAATLRAYQSYRDLFDDWHFWAPTEKSNIEVDFLLWKGESCVAIEVKASRTFKPEFVKGLNALRDSGKIKFNRLILVYLGNEPLRSEGIEVLPLKEILDDIESGNLWK